MRERRERERERERKRETDSVFTIAERLSHISEVSTVSVQVDYPPHCLQLHGRGACVCTYKYTCIHVCTSIIPKMCPFMQRS